MATPIFGSDEEWEEFLARSNSRDWEDGEIYSKLRSLCEGVNQESVPCNSPAEKSMEIPQPLLEVAPAVTSGVLDHIPLDVSDGTQLARVPFQMATSSYISAFVPLLQSALQPTDQVSDHNALRQCLWKPEVFVEDIVRDGFLRGTFHDVRFKDRHEGGRAKRPRAPDWSETEKRAYLELKEAALWVVKGKDWDYISQGLRDRHGFDRSAKCCEDLWGTLRKDFRAIQEHEFSTSVVHTSGWISYWEMDKDGKSRNKLPRLFPLESYTTMERILATQELRKGEPRKTRRIPVQSSLRAEDEHSHLHPANPSGGGSAQHTIQGERSRILDPGGTPNLKYAGRKRSGGTNTVEEDQLSSTRSTMLVKNLVEDAVNSALHHLRPCRESRCGATDEDDDPIATLSLHLTQLVEEDELITRLARSPFFKKLIADEVSSALEPVSTALLVLEHGDHEYQEELRAIAEKKRAIALEEMQLLKRRRVGRHQRTLTASYKQRGPRDKTSSARAIIPALEGLNLVRDEDKVNNTS